MYNVPRDGDKVSAGVGEAVVRWWKGERTERMDGMGRGREWRAHTAKSAPEHDVVRVEHVFAPRRLRATGMISSDPCLPRRRHSSVA